MKLTSPVLALVLAVSCGPSAGALGIHKGDTVKLGYREGSVTSVGEGWVEFRECRYNAEQLHGISGACPHKK